MERTKNPQPEDSASCLTTWLLRGQRGAISFTTARFRLSHRPAHMLVDTEGFTLVADWLCSHAPSKGTGSKWDEECPYLQATGCWGFEYSPQRAVDIARVWMEAGYDDEALWKELEALYEKRFGRLV